MRGRTRLSVGIMIGAVAAALTAPAATASSRVDVIVVYVDGVSDAHATTEAVARQHGADPRWVYEDAIEGFAGNVPEGRLEGLRNDPRVDYVERDQAVTTAAQTMPTGIERIFADDNPAVGIDGTDDVRVDVDVAVIDTGIDLDHPDLVVATSTNCLGHTGGSPWTRAYVCDGTGDDGNGHGTHVAGTIGALDNGAGVVGVAPGARLHAVKVLDDNGSGSWGSVIAGIDHVTGRGDIEVANLSLGGGESTAVDDALAGAADAGVALALAAGNDATDVDDYGPAGHPDALTVSALADFDGAPGAIGSPSCRTDEDDTFANFSNYGDTAGDDVDVVAPGVCILSTWKDGDYHTISGTSMAAPHVAGALALLASGTNSPADITGVDALYDDLLGATNMDWATSTDPDDTPDPLLDVGDSTVFAPAFTDGSGGGGGDNAAPTASFTYSCTDLDCNFDGSGSSDSDGSITSYDWDFGDDNTSTAETTSHTYGGDGTYTVTLTVTDDDGATGTSSQQVSVATAGSDGMTLSATGYKVKGLHHADLAWSGATSTNVDVYRDGSVVVTTANDGAYTDEIGNRGGASYTYQVCEAGTTTCSNTATVTF